MKRLLNVNMSKLREMFRLTVLFKGVVVGSLVGVVVAMYRLVTIQAAKQSLIFYSYLRHNPMWVPAGLLMIVFGGYLISRGLQKVPSARGGGLIQVEERLNNNKQQTQFEVMIVRFVGGVVGALFGVSLGRAGPSVHLGATSGELFAKSLGSDEEETNHLITAGASAGLAATFNTPISGILFVYEKMHKTLKPKSILFVISAVFVADAISVTMFGLSPILYYVDIPTFLIRYLPELIVLGALAGIIGVLIPQVIASITTVVSKCPEELKPMVVLFTALVVGLSVPQLCGGGQNLIQLAETVHMPMAVLIGAFVIKLVFTAICAGSGFPGGLIMPTLALGALLGSGVAQLLQSTGMPISMVAIFCVCSMAGVLGSSFGIPITSIFLMVEMTGSLNHIIPITITTLVATASAYLMNRFFAKWSQKTG